MQHPDEGTIHAWLDGELSADEAQALESHVATCAECSATVAEARGLVAASSRIVSALDIVPGDVIPSATRTVRRARWYSTAQFRAAAGFLIVAGASLLLLNRGQEESARSKMVTLAAKPPAAESVSAPAAALADAQAVAVEAEAAPKAREKRTSSPAATAQKTPAAPEVSAATERMPEKIIDAPAQVVVTGAATASAPPATLRATAMAADEATTGLKLISSDTSQAAVRNVYEVRKGVEVTLVETTLPSQRFGATAAERQKQAAPRPMTAAAPPPVANQAQPAVNVITWVKGEKIFTLSGVMSQAELEALKARLPEDKR